jgi:uncharacterized protein (DUF2236 family)
LLPDGVADHARLGAELGRQFSFLDRWRFRGSSFAWGTIGSDLASAGLPRMKRPQHTLAMSPPRTHLERLQARDGYFSPESVVRRLGNSPVTPFLGGGSAVLLQVAHPLVACGVVDHSGYDRNLWRRLVGTLRALYLITFGDREEAEHAGAAVQAVHERVHGQTRRQLGPFPAGTSYSASDPELMLWVHATLVHSSLAAYERFVQPLTPEEKQRYHEEMNLVARLFGTPAQVLPGSYGEFQAYFDAQLRSDAITVTQPARQVADVILAASLPAPLRVLAPAHRLATTHILPPKLRHQYGLRWTTLHDLALPLAGATVRYGTTPILSIARRLKPLSPRLAA